MRQLNTEAEAAAAAPGQTPDAEAALVAVSALDPKTTGAACCNSAAVHPSLAHAPAGLTSGLYSDAPASRSAAAHCQPPSSFTSLCAQPLSSLFSLFCAEVMLEEEVREAVISTAGTAAGARAAGWRCMHSRHVPDIQALSFSVTVALCMQVACTHCVLLIQPPG